MFGKSQCVFTDALISSLINQRKMKKYFLLSLITCFATAGVVAQNQLSGNIKDAITASPIQGATIYIPDLKTGATSDETGTFFIYNIPQGTYFLQTTLIGYATKFEKVTIAGAVTINLTLDPSGEALQELVVTGVSTATERRKNPVPIGTITQAEMLQNISSNVIDALTSIPGVSQITEGPSISKPVIRGLGYNRVVVVNDGVRQEGQQWGDEFGIEIDENTIGKAEILKGPTSLSYGSDAMAGVINFLSPTPLPEGKIKGSLLSNYQTNNGLISNSLNFAGNLGGFLWDLRYTTKQAHNYQNQYDGYVWNSSYDESDLKAIIGVNRKWGYSHLRLSSYDLKLGVIEGARDSATGKFTTHYLDGDKMDSLGLDRKSLR